jgi:hypothetical protein
MERMIGRDGNVQAVDVAGQSFYRDRKGGYDVESKQAIAALKREGFTEAALNPYDAGDSERGFTCVECGFGSWFSLCSRCGHNNAKDTPTDGNS